MLKATGICICSSFCRSAMWARLHTELDSSKDSLITAAAICSVTKAECPRRLTVHAQCWVPASMQSVLCGLASSCGLPRLLLIQCSQKARTESMASPGSLVWSGTLLSLHSNVKLHGKASQCSGDGCKDSKAILQRNMCTWCQFLSAFGSLPI